MATKVASVSPGDVVDVVYRDTYGQNWSARVMGTATQLATPAAPTITNQGTAGTTAYRYRVSAVDADGVESLASTGGTTGTGAATLTGTNFNRVTWVAVTGAVSYNVYGRTGADGALLLMKTGITGLTYDDKGTDTPAGALPTTLPAGTVKLRIWYGAIQVIKNGVRRATGLKQTNRYYYY